MDTNEFFTMYEKISQLIETRFDQYTKICSKSQYGDLSSWIYDCGSIEIYWNAYWIYGGHDSGIFYMPLEWIEMTDEEWTAFLNKFKHEQEKEKRKEERAEKRRKLKQERAEYEELKRKFETEEN